MYDGIFLRTVEIFGRLFGGFSKSVAKNLQRLFAWMKGTVQEIKIDF